MKIFFIDPQSYNALGEYDRLFLAELDNIVEVEPIFYCNENFEADVDSYQTVKIFKYQKYKQNIRKVFSYIYSYLTILLHISSQKPDVVHIQWYRALLIDIFIFYCIKFLSKKIVYTCHNFRPHNTGKKYDFMRKYLYDLFSTIFVHDHSTYESLIELGIHPSKIIQIEYGLTPLSPKHNSIKCNKKVHPITFLFCGFISEYKGIENFIKPWKKVFKDSKDFEFKIAGKFITENYSKYIKEMSIDSKNIIIDDKFQTIEQFKENILGSHVIVLPYKEASQSAVLMTVLTFGRKVIVSDVGGLGQTFRKAPFIGWMFKTENDLINILRNLKETPRENFFLDAKENLLLENKFSWKNTVGITMQVYKNEN